MQNIVSAFPSCRLPAGIAVFVAVAFAGAGPLSHASDHLDSPTVIADARADIGDLYAWTSTDGRRLNLVMTIVAHSFSEKVQYVFHVDSGPRFNNTTATTQIVCEFPAASIAECRVEDLDFARGDAGGPLGIEGQEHRFRVYAGLRDDPFFNNVKGTRTAYKTAATALKNGAVRDAAGCPRFDRGISQTVLSQWRQTDGGPATNFLAGWTPSSVVISVDLDLVNTGGKMLAVWGATMGPKGQIDRAARPLTGNALLGTVAADAESDALKEKYNAATPATSAQFVPEIEKGLALYDGFDGTCGNQSLAKPDAAPSKRYQPLASLLADDRLWVNSASSVCTQLFAVELAHLAGKHGLRGDCGGRTPNYDAANVWRSLLVNGTVSGVDDGLHRDEHEHSSSVFPFLAAPDAVSADRK